MSIRDCLIRSIDNFQFENTSQSRQLAAVIINDFTLATLGHRNDKSINALHHRFSGTSLVFHYCRILST